MLSHKAFIFDFNFFSNELAPILWRALTTNTTNELEFFIKNNIAWLKDPYEGEPLTANWQDLLEYKDVSQVADFALTKYYQPKEDFGLDQSWQTIEIILATHFKNETYSPVLGEVFGTSINHFDPGKLGSYFQNNSQAYHSLLLLQKIEGEIPLNAKHNFSSFKNLLNQAVQQSKGLYITF